MFLHRRLPVVLAWALATSHVFGQGTDTYGLVVEAAGEGFPKKVDAFGDPLPLGALARLGTCRLKHENAAHIAASPKGDVLVTMAPGEIRLWKIPSGEEYPWRLASSSAETRLMQVRFLDNGSKLETLLNNGQLQRWEIATGNLLDQTMLGVQREDPTHSQREIELGNLRGKLDGHAVRLVDRATGKNVGPQRGHDAAVKRLAFASNSQALATHGDDGRLVIWDLKTHAPLWSQARTSLRCFAFSPDGRRLAIGEGDPAAENSRGVLRILDASQGKELHAFDVHGSAVFSVAFAPDGKRLATAGADNRARLWDTEKWADLRHFLPRRPRNPNQTVNPWIVNFSRDGKLLAACSADDEEINLWPHEGLGEPVRIPRHWFVSFLDDGKTLVAQNHFGYQSLRQIADGRELNASKTPGWLIRPDGRMMLVPPGDGRHLRLWDRVLDEEFYTLYGHEGKTSAGCFSSDGTLLATADSTGVVLMWNIASPPEIRLESLWAKLKRDSTKDAARAVNGFVETRDEGVRFLGERLQPVGARTMSISQLVAELDHRQFLVRHKATRQLERLGRLIEPELKMALRSPPSLEAKARLQRLLERATDSTQPTGDERAALRSISVLERIGSAEAKEILTRLAGGHLNSLITLEAQRSLDRLGKR